MDKVISWLIQNWLTIVSIILSGIISLVISAAYYHKGNRNNLQMTMLFPIIRLLNSGYSRKNYEMLCDLSENYCARYLTKKERCSLVAVLSAYKEICWYKESTANADSLRSYFEFVLEKNGIEVKPVPIYYENEIVYYDYPDNLHYIHKSLQEVLDKYDVDYEMSACQEEIVSLYSYFCKNCYGCERKLDYFEDYTLKEVLEKSVIQMKWAEKFKKMENAKNGFLSQKIVKDLLS